MTDNKTTDSRQNFEHSFLEAFDQFLEELSQLAARDVDHGEFYGFLLDRLTTLTSANHAAVWVSTSSSSFVEAITKGERPSSIASSELNKAVDETKPVVLLLQNQRLIIGKIDTQAAPTLVLSIALPAEESEKLQRVYSDLLAAVCDIGADFHRNQSLNSQQQRFEKLQTFIQLIGNSHSSLEPHQVGYHLTNDSRHFLGADRVWLFRAPDAKLLSCSGVAEVNSRTRTFKHLRRIARTAIRSGNSLAWQGDGSESSDHHLAEYCQSTSLDALYASPITNRGTADVVAVLIVEMFAQHDRISLTSSLAELSRSIGSSVANSLQFSQIPFRRTLVAFNWVLNRFSWRNLFGTLVSLAIVSALLSSLFLIKNDFYVQIEGQMRPVNERHVFAPSDGVVESTSVEYGDQVLHSQKILKMTSPEYQLKLKQLQGDMDAARKQLETNQILRNQANQEAADEFAVGKLTAEIEQNLLEIEHINERIQFYLRLTGELEISAPIKGQIISRDVAKTLLNRPVAAGSRLLTVADTAADWHVVFDIPDRELGYLNESLSDDQNDWAIEYRLASQLEEIYTAKINRIESNNSFKEDGQAIVKAYSEVDKTQFDNLRVGQSVNGRAFCGRKSLFFIWTRDIRDFLPRELFLDVVMINQLKFAMLFALALCMDSSETNGQSSTSGQYKIESAVLQLVSEIEMPATAAGPLSKILVVEGSMVNKSQMLATINDDEASVKLEEALIELDIVKQQAQSEVDIKFALKSKQVAIADFRRAQESNKKYAGVVSDREMDRLKLLVEKSDAELEKMRFEKTILARQIALKEAAVRKHRFEVERHKVRATLAGQIVQLNKREGEWVNVADPILKLVQLDRLQIEDFLPSDIATKELVGAKAAFITDESKSIHGVVVFVSPNVDPLNSKASVRIEFENPDLELRPGIKGTVVIDTNTKMHSAANRDSKIQTAGAGSKKE